MLRPPQHLTGTQQLE